MELQKYRLFVDLAETGNLTRTGERMGYTQSGVSRFLKGLEKELGFAVFLRTRRGLSLTAAGETLLPAARALLKSGEQIEQLVRDLNAVERGSVTVGLFPGISAKLLPDILHAFFKSAPKVTLKAKEGSRAQIERWMQDGLIDFGLGTRCSQSEWLPLWRERLLVVLRREGFTGQPHSIPLQRLSEQALILPTRDVVEEINPLLEASGHSFHIRAEAADGRTILSMVRHGLGFGVLPELSVDTFDDDLLALPLEPSSSRELGISIRAAEDATPAARQLIACIRTYALEHPQLDIAEARGSTYNLPPQAHPIRPVLSAR